MLAQLGLAVSHLRLRPFDVSTAEGRASERYRLAIWNAIANTLSTGIGMLAFLITVPLTLSYLGAERFGVWMTVASLAGMLSFLDFGVANSLVNFVAKAKAGGDAERLSQIATRGLLLLTLIGVGIGLLVLVVNAWYPLSTLLKVEDPAARQEAASALLVFVAIFACSIPINGIPRILAGMQEAWRAHLAKIAASTLSLVLVWGLSRNQASVPVLLLATFGVQTAAPLLLLPRFWRAGWLKRRAVSGSASRQADFSAMGEVGGLFLMLQIGTMIGWGADALLVSAVLGASEVGKLVIVQRLFQFVTIPLAIINTPLWAAYADARERNDHDFIRRTLRRSLTFTVCSALLLSGTIYLMSNWLVTHWLQQSLALPLGLLTAYAGWAVIDASCNAFAMYLNGTSVVRTQVILVTIFCIAALPLKLLMMHQQGVAGVIYGTIIAHLICVMPSIIVMYYRAAHGRASKVLPQLARHD